MIFWKENQIRGPVVRKEYVEVQDIDWVSYKSMHTTTRVDKKWLPVTARVIPGVALPLLVGMNFRDGHAECPDMQRQVNISSRIPGIFQIPNNPDSLFARSLKRVTAGIHYAQERVAPIPLGDDFPYKPGDLVHFLVHVVV